MGLPHLFRFCEAPTSLLSENILVHGKVVFTTHIPTRSLPAMSSSFKYIPTVPH